MHRCTFVRHPCVFEHQHKTLKSLKYTAATLSSRSSSVSVSDSYNRQMCSPFCPVLHQHLSSVFIDILPKKPSLHLNVCPSLLSKGSFYKVKRLVAAAAHLSCCFWVSRPCWMQINKIQNKVGNSRCMNAKSLFCWIFVMQRKPEQTFLCIFQAK